MLEEALTCSSAGDLGIQITPIRIVLLYQSNLPRPRPFLQPFLTVDRRFNVLKAFEINQTIHVIILGEAFGRTGFMFVHAPNEVVRHADVKRATNAASKDVDVEAARTHLPPLGY